MDLCVDCLLLSSTFVRDFWRITGLRRSAEVRDAELITKVPSTGNRRADKTSAILITGYYIAVSLLVILVALTSLYHKQVSVAYRSCEPEDRSHKERIETYSSLADLSLNIVTDRFLAYSCCELDERASVHQLRIQALREMEQGCSPHLPY